MSHQTSYSTQRPKGNKLFPHNFVACGDSCRKINMGESTWAEYYAALRRLAADPVCPPSWWAHLHHHEGEQHGQFHLENSRGLVLCQPMQQLWAQECKPHSTHVKTFARTQMARFARLGTGEKIVGLTVHMAAFLRGSCIYVGGVATSLREHCRTESRTV